MTARAAALPLSTLPVSGPVDAPNAFDAFDEAAHLKLLAHSAAAVLDGSAVLGCIWTVVNYLDLAEAVPAERRRPLYKTARAWVELWAARSENFARLERLAPRSWLMAELWERRLAAQEAALGAKLEKLLAKRKRPFVNAREEAAFVARKSAPRKSTKPAVSEPVFACQAC